METDYAEFEVKGPADRNFMNIMYGMHTLAPFTAWSLSVVALILNYIKRSHEHDAIYASHHNYMISTFWWTVMWLVISGFVALVLAVTIVGLLVAWLPFVAVGLWYIYRCVRGWIRFNNGEPPM